MKHYLRKFEIRNPKQALMSEVLILKMGKKNLEIFLKALQVPFAVRLQIISHQKRSVHKAITRFI